MKDDPLLDQVANALAEEYRALAIDPRRLRPSELIRLVNSTPLGEVLGDRKLRQHRGQAGFRIGDARHVDLLRYAGWLVHQRHKIPQEGEGEGADSEAYQRHRDRAADRQRRIAKSGRDIGELPPVANPDRRAQAAASFRVFCETYFPANFYLEWSKDHDKVIAKIERSVREGGLFALAMPRGSGKTALCRVACLWAILNGHRQFVVFIGATAEDAKTSMKVVREELEDNDLLLDDYPEACYPIRCLEGKTQRRPLYRGEQVRVSLTDKWIILPWIPGSASAGVALTARGIMGSIRGLSLRRGDLGTIRPDLVIIDDPQNDRTADSPIGRVRIERTLTGAILGLAGPGKKIAGIMPCTVISSGDVADRVLDRKKFPQWNGERCKALYSLPINDRLWEQYAEVYAEGMLADDDGQAANAFYAANREAMDVGAEVAWPARFEPGDLSALQTLMNVKLFKESAFWSEYQNDPRPDVPTDTNVLTAEQIASKVNRFKQAWVPATVTQLTAFIDVQATLLFWAVCGWEPGFTGYVLDYGAWPDQRRGYFSLRDAKQTLLSETQAGGLEASIYAGLDRLTTELLGREWKGDTSSQRIGRCLIDSGYQTDTIFRFCRQSPHAGILMPSHGSGIKASGLAMNQWPPRPGEERGRNWLIRPSTERGLRSVVFDTNFWKSFVHARLASGMVAEGSVNLAEKGGLSLFGDKASRHRMLADHLTSERRDKVTSESRGRTVEEWQPPPPGRDNHWLDCVVGCAVAASMLKISLEVHGEEKPARRRVSFRAMQQEAQQRRRLGG